MLYGGSGVISIVFDRYLDIMHDACEDILSLCISYNVLVKENTFGFPIFKLAQGGYTSQSCMVSKNNQLWNGTYIWIMRKDVLRRFNTLLVELFNNDALDVTNYDDKLNA